MKSGVRRDDMFGAGKNRRRRKATLPRASLSGLKAARDEGAIRRKNPGAHQPGQDTHHLRDITRREQALRSASAYTRSLIEASLDPFVTISPAGKITDVNGASVQATGVPREKLIGTDFSDYFTEPAKAREGYRKVFSEGLVRDYPLAIRHVSGRVTEVLYNAAVYRDGMGQVLGVFAAARDITKRKEAEQALRSASAYTRSLIEASLDPLVTISAEGKITDVNEASVQATGVPRDKLIGTDFSDYFTEPEKAREGYRRVFSQGFVRDYPLAIRHRSGAITEVLYNASVFRNEQGQVLGVFAAARDITERKRAEAQVQQLNAELEQRVRERTAELTAANKELEAFSYSVSHDLRAPLRHVAGFADLLAKAAGPGLQDRSRHYLEEILDSVKQMGCLIDDLLLFSRMGRAEMRLEAVDLEALVNDARKQLEPENKGRDIRWKQSALLPVQADGALLRQVLFNLLSNALKYTRPRQPAEIEIGCDGSSPEEIVVFVRDNGVGFDMAYADKLFGVFQRLHSDKEFEGTGIGLASVRRIIARHGGRTWAEGKVNAGATFYFSLPKNPSST